MRQETIELNGHSFHVYRWGDPKNPPLLLLHGFPEFGGAWDDIAPLLTDRFYCVAPDQRGFGQSWSPSEVSHYTLSNLVGDMVALIDQLGGTTHVFGHDWGAAVAYGLAMRVPEKVERLIVGNGVHPVPFQRSLAAGGEQTEASQYINFLRRKDAADRLAKNDFDGLLGLFSAKMDLTWLHGEKLAQYKAAWRNARQLDAMTNWYKASPLIVPQICAATPDLPEFPKDKLMVRCPHLLIWGEGDTALLPEATDGLEAFAPDLTRVTIPGVDHWLIHQRPDLVAKAVLDWV